MAPLLLLLSLLVPATLPCGPISVPSGNSFCATQSCKLHPFTTATAKAGLVWHLPSPGTHIYNFRPCSYYNPVSCTCAVADASCDADYTMDADGTKCYIRRYPMSLPVSTSVSMVAPLSMSLSRTGQTSWANAQTLCQSNGDIGLAEIT